MRITSLFALALAPAALACDGSDGTPRDTLSSGSAVEEVADALGCESVEDIFGYEAAPIRGLAATRGVTCVVGDAEVDVFDRAPVGDLDDSDESFASAQGGSDENVSRLLGLGVSDASCVSWGLVEDEWFVVSDSEQLLRDLRTDVDDGSGEVVVMSPPASYAPPGVCR